MADERDEFDAEEGEVELTFDVEETEDSAGSFESGQAAETMPAETGGGDQALRSEVQQMKDAYLRARADLDNYKKRAEREKVDYRKFALADFMRDLLPVLDNFERALDHADAGDDFQTGIELIYKQLADVLQKTGLTPVGEVGEMFDPNLHEAIARDDNPELPSHTISAVLQRGYMLSDRLLRPAMVRVAMNDDENAS